MTGLLASLFGLRRPQFDLDPEAWRRVLERPVFTGLDGEEIARLEDLARRLVTEKTFSGAGGQAVDAAMASAIAAFAALPVLNLGYEWYRGWNEIIVYPGEFVPERDVVDAAGIVHRVRQPLSGEAWAGGPMVLSWQDVESSGLGEGFNVVIHEFAHKLDMKNGSVNGHPPLPERLDDAEWARVFGSAYRNFCLRVDAGVDTAIDPYAAESPAEFFAVLTECFFELPDVLHASYQDVYVQLQRFFLQDPLARLEHPQ